MIQLEDKETQNLEQIRKLKSDLETANKSVKPSDISTNWVQVVTKGSKTPRKPGRQWNDQWVKRTWEKKYK